MQAECMLKLQSSLQQLNVTVKPASTCDTSSVGNSGVVTANGEFVFRTRHRKMIQKLSHRYVHTHTYCLIMVIFHMNLGLTGCPLTYLVFSDRQSRSFQILSNTIPPCLSWASTLSDSIYLRLHRCGSGSNQTRRQGGSMGSIEPSFWCSHRLTTSIQCPCVAITAWVEAISLSGPAFWLELKKLSVVRCMDHIRPTKKGEKHKFVQIPYH